MPSSVIKRSLVREGLATDVAGDGEEAIWMASAVDYDAIVLDVMLPRRSGFEACRILRERGIWSPVLMLTARDGVEDRVAGLDSGADDYLVKPFALAELHARLRSLVRRGRPERPTVLQVADLRLDPARREVHRGDVPIDLSAKEFALLEALMRRPGDVLSRLELIEHRQTGGVCGREIDPLPRQPDGGSHQTRPRQPAVLAPEHFEPRRQAGHRAGRRADGVVDQLRAEGNVEMHEFGLTAPCSCAPRTWRPWCRTGRTRWPPSRTRG